MLLIDARKGILTQTRRHAHILALMGIRHVAVAVNKMDLVGFDRAVFDRHAAEIAALVATLGFTDVVAIPVSALKGDNVSARSTATPWFEGPTIFGWLETVAVTETGVQVRKGQPLATLFSNDVYLAQTEFVHALRSVESAPSKEMAEVHRSLADAARKRLAVLGVPAIDIEAVAKTRKAERLVVVRAPVSGRVLARNAFPSAFVQPGTELFTLADLSRVWFVADVPESEAVQVRRGQHAEIRFPAYPTRVFSARATFVYPLADSSARKLAVRRAEYTTLGVRTPPCEHRCDAASFIAANRKRLEICEY